MTNLSKKVVVKTNLDNATPEQKERFMKNLNEAIEILYRSVLERHYKQVTQSLEK